MNKIVLKLSVAMPNSSLQTNFQLNIFIFEAKTSLQTLLHIQSIKQVRTVEPRNSVLQNSRKPRISAKFSNDQIFHFLTTEPTI